MKQVKLLILSIAVVILNACTAGEDPSQKQRGALIEQYEENKDFEIHQVYGNKKLISNIESSLKKLNGINDVKMIIYNKTFVISVDADHKVEKTKDMVVLGLRELVKDNMAYIIVDDPSMMHRVEHLQQRIFTESANPQLDNDLRILMNDLGTEMQPIMLK